MAVREQVISASPCAARFEYAKRQRRAKTLVDTLTVRGLLRSVEGLKYEPVILAMLGGGLRLEEAAALRWEDVSPWTFKGAVYAVVKIDKTIVTAKGGKKLQCGTKTELSQRDAVIGEPFASRLLTLRERGGGGALVPSGRDNGKDGSGHTAPATMAHNWKAWCEAHNVEYVRLGDMRTCWSTMPRRGGQPRFAGVHGHGPLGRNNQGQPLPEIDKTGFGDDRRLPPGSHRERRRGRYSR